LTDTLQRSRRTRPPIHVESGSDVGAPEIGSSSAAGAASSSTSRCRRIAVVGCGHVGLVLAAGLVRLGHEVVGVDVAEGLVADLNDGVLYLHEPGLSELLSDGLENGRLRFTTNYDAAIPEAELIFLAVDTPQTLAGAANMRNIREATRSIALALNGSSPIIVNKSTSPIGTGETIEEILRSAFQERQREPRIVSNPEFLRQGRAVEDFLNPDRIVIGSRSAADAQEVAELFQPLGGEVIVTDLRTAEMIKYVSNAFLATRVSFINEVSRLCEAIGVDIDSVIDGIAEDPRIGRSFFHPGIGFGGSCLPKDVAALRFIGETHGVATPVLSGVQEVNQAQRTGAVRRLRARLGSLEGRTIGVWGLTFKAHTEDTRESPALDVVGLLTNAGAIVQSFDPAVAKNPALLPEQYRHTLRASPAEAARGAHALAVLTDWPHFATADFTEIRDGMAGRLIFDGRNVLDKAAVEALGFAYMGVGRTPTLPLRRRDDV
jgi:UDPglucose 6-dehydrogenase